MFTHLVTGGSPVSAGVSAVVDQPRSSSCFLPIQSVNNNGECICTSCLVGSAGVMSASCVGGLIGGAFSCFGASTATSVGFGIGSAGLSLIGMVGGLVCVTHLSDAISMDYIAVTTAAPTVLTVSAGIDNAAFQGDEPTEDIRIKGEEV